MPIKKKCRYGATGQECKFRHPKQCQKLIKFGDKGPNGCHNGSQCELLHPLMCYNSLNKKACYNSFCKYRHVRGTWHKEPGSVQIAQRPVHDDANKHVTFEQPQNKPVSLNREPGIQQCDFLEIMRALQQNMMVINQRLDGMAKNQPSQSQMMQSSMQNPQPVTQNVWTEKKNWFPQSQLVNQMIPMPQMASQQYC
jgi:hypothetical protein